MDTIEIAFVLFACLLMLLITCAWIFYIYTVAKQKKRTLEDNAAEKIELLKMEFEYARETSLDAQKDRLTLLNFYIGLYAGVTSLLLGLSELIGLDSVRQFTPYILFGLTVVSFIFILFMVRLRQAWLSSVKAMNVIKEYFFKRNPELHNYIIWTMDTLPKPEKFKTINYLSAILIAVLGTSALVIGLLLLSWNAVFIGFFAIIYFSITVGVFHLMLRNDW